MLYQVFCDVLNVEEDLRDEFIHNACDGDISLINKVQSMLKSDSEVSDASDITWTNIIQPSVTPAKSLIGTSINSFQIVKLLGQGGMGSVYLAERLDKEFEQKVAIKIIHPHLSHIIGKQALTREAGFMARLTHANIGKVFDAGVTKSNLSFIVMEYVQGINFTDFIKLPTTKFKGALQLFTQLCDAIKHAHQVQVIHADLKPDNILIDKYQQLKVLDFGVSRLFSSKEATSSPLSTDYLKAMTKEYASPELLNGEAANSHTDTYALGKIFSIIIEHFQHECSKQVKAELLSIINKATSKNINNRYVSVDAFKSDVVLIQIKKIPNSFQCSTWYRLKKFCFVSNRITSALLLAIIISILLILILAKQYITEYTLTKTITAYDQSNVETGYVKNKLSELIDATNSNLTNDNEINKKQLSKKAQSIINDTKLSVEFRFSLAMKYGEAKLLKGDLLNAADYFQAAYELGLKWQGTSTTLTTDSLYKALAKLIETQYKSNNLDQALVLSEQYIPNVEKLTYFNEDMVNIIKLYFTMLSESHGQLSSLTPNLLINIGTYLTHYKAELGLGNYLEISLKYSNAFYYQFDGDEFSITTQKTHDEINKITQTMNAVEFVLLAAIKIAEQKSHPLLPNLLVMLAKVSFELKNGKHLSYGEKAYQLAIKNHQTKYHPEVLNILLKYYSVVQPYNHQLSFELIKEAKDIEDTLNSQKKNSSHIIKIFYGSQLYFMGSIEEIIQRGELALIEVNSLDDYYLQAAQEYSLWNVYSIMSIPYPTKKTLKYLKHHNKIDSWVDEPSYKAHTYYKIVEAYLDNEDFERTLGLNFETIFKKLKKADFPSHVLINFAKLYALANKPIKALILAKESEKRTNFTPYEEGLLLKAADHYSDLASIYAILEEWDEMKRLNDKAKVVIDSSDARLEYLTLTTTYHDTLYNIFSTKIHNISKNSKLQKIESLQQLLIKSKLDNDHPLFKEIERMKNFINKKHISV